jgi:hypothetical protein
MLRAYKYRVYKYRVFYSTRRVQDSTRVEPEGESVML